MVIYRVRILGSGPHTPTQFFLGVLPGVCFLWWSITLPVLEYPAGSCSQSSVKYDKLMYSVCALTTQHTCEYNFSKLFYCSSQGHTMGTSTSVTWNQVERCSSASRKAGGLTVRILSLARYLCCRI